MTDLISPTIPPILTTYRFLSLNFTLKATMHIPLLFIILATLATSQDAPACLETSTPTCCPTLSFSSPGYLGGPCGEAGVPVANLTECTTTLYPNGLMCCIETVSLFSFLVILIISIMVL